MAILLDPSSITGEVKTLLSKKCCIKPNKTIYDKDPDIIECISVQEEGVYVPLGIWKDLFTEFPKYEKGFHKKISPSSKCTKKMYTKQSDPKGYRDQDVVTKIAYNKLLEDHTTFISAPPGYGKTSCGNYLCHALGLKTMLMCHIKKVNEQWVDEFKTFSTSKVQFVSNRLKSGNFLDPTADIYVVGVRKSLNIDPQEFIDCGIGTIIFDEVHVATVVAFSKVLLRIMPLYVIGLSATPERHDGLQKLITMYFGPKKNFIHREEVKEFIVYKYETDYIPEINYKILYGDTILDWTKVINSIAYNEKRQLDIANIALSHPDRRTMILSDRVEECTNIYNIIKKLTEEDPKYQGITVHNIKNGSSPEVVQSASILVAGKREAGVGFNDPTRTMLILTTTCKDVRQNEGRIRTVNNIIYDLVDNFKTFENHWDIREKWYIKRGATIKTIPRKTPLIGGKKETPAIEKRRLPKI